MTATTIYITNIAHTITAHDLLNFFSYCGHILSHTLTPTTSDPTGPQSGSITFSHHTAANSALLLDGTPLNNVPLRITTAHSLDDLAGPQMPPPTDGEIKQEHKPRSTILAEYLAEGYAIGDAALQRAITLDRKHHFSERFAGYLGTALDSIDEKIHASKYTQKKDQKYHFSEKARAATISLQRYFETAMGSGMGTRIRTFYDREEKKVVDIHNEAKRLRDEKRKGRVALGESSSGQAPGMGSGQAAPGVGPDQTQDAIASQEARLSEIQQAGTAPGDQAGATPGLWGETAPGNQAGATPGQWSEAAPGYQASAAPGNQAGATPGLWSGAAQGHEIGKMTGEEARLMEMQQAGHVPRQEAPRPESGAV